MSQALSRRQTIPFPPTHHEPPKQEQDDNKPNDQEADNRKWMFIEADCSKSSDHIHERPHAMTTSGTPDTTIWNQMVFMIQTTIY